MWGRWEVWEVWEGWEGWEGEPHWRLWDRERILNSEFWIGRTGATSGTSGTGRTGRELWILNWAQAASLRQRGYNLKNCTCGCNWRVYAAIGNELREGNVWETYEKNKLLNNDQVTSIEIIDPKTKKSKGFIKGCNG